MAVLTIKGTAFFCVKCKKYIILYRYAREIERNVLLLHTHLKRIIQIFINDCIE